MERAEENEQDGWDDTPTVVEEIFRPPHFYLLLLFLLLSPLVTMRGLKNSSVY